MSSELFLVGGSGFLGRFVLTQLVETGIDVIALARSDESANVIASLGGRVARGDLDDGPGLEHLIARSGTQMLVNLASLGFGHTPTIVQAAERSGVRRAVFVSTTAIFTHLPTATKAARRAAETTICESTLEWTIARPTMIYGARGDRNMERLLRFLTRTRYVPVPGGGMRLQQPVHVEDLATAIVTIVMTSASTRRTYNLAGPEPLTLRQVIQHAGHAVGCQPRLVPVPIRPSISVLRVYERVARAPRIRAEQVERLAEDKAFDIDAARGDLGYEPRHFAIGIHEEARALGLARNQRIVVQPGRQRS